MMADLHLAKIKGSVNYSKFKILKNNLWNVKEELPLLQLLVFYDSDDVENREYLKQFLLMNLTAYIAVADCIDTVR